MTDSEWDSYIQVCKTIEQGARARTEHIVAQQEKERAAEAVLCAVQLWYERGDDTKLSQAWEAYRACSQKEQDAGLWVQLLRESSSATSDALVISEDAFKRDPAEALKAAKNVPHVTVKNALGQVRMVIVRQRTNLEDKEES